ncbi:NYN domain-containing protein [Actinoplanes derwentensis]|uniref:Predicted RNA-binding protein containing a PIN domain n=1 Tax=Actinoplanes derwentensis TaxID=113562 RepID=A0A1H2C1R6_9ACTN|nr:NYN domain-containing protein [Actinoplanes derwentensis]GID84707.1 RNA-binding protein [Actinoplanes derwentensis]SDT64468.1 Predicted RNA-binding protein containing a PIN domain [Actinoplanes derwentensis]
MSALQNPDDRPEEEAAPEAAELTLESGLSLETDISPEPVLPEAVRQRITVLAAAALPALPPDELPVALRRVARFAPNRRARLGGRDIAAQLVADPLFRQRIGARIVTEAGDLGAAVTSGVAPAAADPVEVAALAYLARPDGWRELIGAAGDAVRAEADSAAVTAQARAAEQRATRAEHDRAVARVEADKLRDELARVREEMGQIREEARSTAKALREAQAAQKRASDLLATEKGRATRVNQDHEAEVRRMKSRLADAEAAAASGKQAAKDARSVDDARLWLLLETINQAATGLKRELALNPADKLPADFVADVSAERPGAPERSAARAQDTDDPGRLDQLLALPRAHLVVDGYNVTKRGFADMSLEQQRKRLITGLGGIAAQTGDEVTVVFDGAERVHGLPPAPRGVRVLFSRKGMTADELIRQLVRAEPPGRPVVVVSSDREVADGVRRHGAYPMGADSLLRRLSRS